jgi:hypothetical protein
MTNRQPNKYKEKIKKGEETIIGKPVIWFLIYKYQTGIKFNYPLHLSATESKEIIKKSRIGENISNYIYKFKWGQPI